MDRTACVGLFNIGTISHWWMVYQTEVLEHKASVATVNSEYLVIIKTFDR